MLSMYYELILKTDSIREMSKGEDKLEFTEEKTLRNN